MDVDGDGLLQPTEVDLLNSDEILNSFFEVAGLKHSDHNMSDEL